MRTKLLTAMLSIALLMSVFGSSMVSAALIPTNPIAINGDSDLAGYPGTGSVSDPKVIANLSIDGIGGVGISISNVNLYVTIYNCTILNSGYGIQIVRSNNVTLDNNTITGAAGSHGIFLVSSAATMDRNKLTGCSIELRHSNLNVADQAYIDAMTITSNNTVNGAPVYFLKNQNMNNASVPSGAGEVILLNVTYANVNGLNMRGGAVLFWCSNIMVENNIITGAYDAIYAFSSNKCNYANNRIVDAYHAGVRLYMSSQNTVSNTTITHSAIYSTAYGIVVMNGSHNNVIVGSNVRDTYDGISLSYANGNTVSDNIVTHALGSGLNIVSSNSNNVSNNIVDGSSLRGINSQLSNGNVLFNNTINGARNGGIILWKSFGDIIYGNKIFNSVSYGINLTACNGAVNLIYANVLIGNHDSTSVYNAVDVQANDDSVNHWNNATIGNYWGDWTAPDANKDGIVDSPYVILGGRTDNLPIALSVKIISPASNMTTNSTTAVISGTTSGYVLDDVTWYNAAAGTTGSGIGTRSWTASAGLVLGVNNIFVNATDTQGLTVSDNVIVICDTVGSNLTIISPASGSINTTGMVTVQWNASDALTGIALTEISTDGTTWTTVTGNSRNLTLADGAYTVYVKVTDNAGNVNQRSVSFSVDTVNPFLAINSPISGSTLNNGSVLVQWTVSDATSGIVRTEISTDGTTWTNATGNSHNLTLADGAYTVYVKVTDTVGFMNQTSVSFTVDTVKPVIVISSPGSGSVITNGSVTVQWNSSDATSGIAKTEISTDGTTWTNVTGNSYNLTLADGVHTVYLKVTDMAGNFNQTSVSLTVESSTPVVTAKSPVGSGVSKNTTIVVLFSEPMNQTATTISVNGIAGGLTWSGNNATFTPSSALAYNTVYTVTVNGSDLSGKALTTVSWTFTTLKNEGKITSTLKDASGKAIVGAKAMLSNGMNTTTDANGYFELNNVTSGSYTLTISKDGYKTITKNVNTTAGATTALGTLNAQANESSTDNTLLIAIVVIVIVALLAGAFLVMQRRKKK